MKNDQVTFGAGFNRNDSVNRTFGAQMHSGGLLSSRRDSIRLQQSGVGGGNHRNLSSNLNSEEMGIIKNNPLLKHYPNINDASGFISDLSNSNSECDEDHIIDKSGIIKNILVIFFFLNFYQIFNLTS